MITKEKQQLVQAATMISDGVESIIKLLPSVELQTGDKNVHRSWIAKYLAQALAISNYFKSPATNEKEIFDRFTLVDSHIKEIQDKIEEDFNNNGFKYDVEYGT